MKKLFILIFAFLFSLSLTACGDAQSNEPTPSPEAAQTVTIVNPMRSCTQAELAESTGFPLLPPENAEDVSYFIYQISTPPMAEMRFTLQGTEYSYRICSATEAEDISGMYFEWTQHQTFTLGSCDAELGWNDSAEGCVTWFDAEAGSNHALSVHSGADPDALSALAVQLFAPAEAQSAATDFAEEFSAMLNNFREDYRPGSAGASLRATTFVANLADLFTRLVPTEADLTAAVENFLETLPEEELSAFHSLFQDAADIFRSASGPDSDTVLSSCGYGTANELWNVDNLIPLFEALNLDAPQS